MMLIPGTNANPEHKHYGRVWKMQNRSHFYSVLQRAFNNEAGTIRLDAVCCCRRYTERVYRRGLRLHFLHWAITCNFFTTLLESGNLSNEKSCYSATAFKAEKTVDVYENTLHSLTDSAVRMYFHADIHLKTLYSCHLRRTSWFLLPYCCA